MHKKSKIESIVLTVSGWVETWYDILYTPSRTTRKNVTEKLRNFKPTVTEGFFSNTITWEERETPLTDEELENKYGIK